MEIYGHKISGIELVIGLFLLSTLYSTIKLNFKILMIQTKGTKRLLKFFESLQSEDKLPWVSNAVFLGLYLVLFSIQNNFEINFIDYQEQNFDLIGIYGFVIGILSMYGIYIGFLQFIVGDSEKVRYLGKSKIKYLTDTSIWYQITQTKSFLIILLLTIVSPILIVNTLGELQNSLIYIWQTSVAILLWIYIFLIGMSLQIIRILFLIKDNTDVGLESLIRYSISNKYYELFRKIYHDKFDPNSVDDFYRILDFEVSKVDIKSTGFFLNQVFSKIDREIGYKFGEFKSVKIEKRSFGDLENYLYDDYKKFINAKWKLLSKIQNKIGWGYYKVLIEKDMNSFSQLINETPKLIEKDEIKFNYGFSDRIENINNYLFDQLIEKAISEQDGMESLYKEIYESNEDIKFKIIDIDNPTLLKYYSELEVYKWKKVAKKYLLSEYKFDLPDFSRYDNRELYSQAVFDHLISYYGDLSELIINNKKMSILIQSMDKEHIVAYCLYQLFYPSRDSWDSNTMFFKNELEKIFEWLDNEEKEKLYSSAAKKVSGTLISHRITFKVLMTIYQDREKQIIDMDYFNQFNYSRISPFRILFVQGILVSKNKYSQRIIIHEHQSEKDLRIIENICMDFLRTIDKLPELTECTMLTNSMKHLLKKISMNMNILAHDLDIIGLLYYEFILIYEKGISASTVFIEAITYGEGKEKSIHFWHGSIFTFFVLKLLDSSYESFFANDKFRSVFKSGGINILDNLDVTLEEYIESVYMKLKDSNYGKIGKASLRQISDKLEEILFN